MIYVVAELGVNWNGDYDLLENMMVKVKEADCNAVKFQAFNEKIVIDHPEKNRLLKATITKYNIEKINDLAKSIGIEWFCTPMYSEAVDFLNPFVKRFKVREFDGRPLLKNKTSELLEKLFDTDKEIIISSQRSPRESKYYKHPKIRWLYVVPKYPCEFSDLNFEDFDEFDGYSNHCPEIKAPLAAANLGANIIEIHFTSDKSKNFIDNNVSFDYDELFELVNLIRNTKNIS